MPADFNHFPAAIEALRVGAADAVDSVAKQLAADVQAGAPVRSGYLRDSTYTITSDGASTYTSGEHSLPALPAPGKNTALVAVAAEYAIYVDSGTSRMAANPFFSGAVEAMRGRLADEAARKIGDALDRV